MSKISVLTCYDYSFAKAVDGLLDYVLVGDSVNMVVYGQESTANTEFKKIYYHTQAVARGIKKESKTKIIADLPKNSLVNIKTLFNSAKNLTKAGADFLKIENNPQLINKLSTKNYKVFGHIGYTPQTDSRPTKKGINIQESEDLIKQALEIQEAGAVGIFLELVDAKTSKIITQKLQIPTIGIGSGKDTSGQVLVLYDLIGLYPDFKPSFVKTQEDFQTRIKTAVNKFIEDINLM